MYAMKKKRVLSALLSFGVCLSLMTIGVVSASAEESNCQMVNFSLQPHMYDIKSQSTSGVNAGFYAANYDSNSSKHAVYASLHVVDSAGKVRELYSTKLEINQSMPSVYDANYTDGVDKLFYGRLNPESVFKNCTADGVLYVCSE